MPPLPKGGWQRDEVELTGGYKKSRIRNAFILLNPPVTAASRRDSPL